MCTVSVFYKGNNDFVLTSNRDEAPNRKALAPDFYGVNDAKVLMPKDEQSGGSWIGVSDKNRVVCLLNGGFEIHKRRESYRQSRGVVVNDLLALDSIHDAHDYNFNDIEPFTIVVVDWKPSINFYEIVWDGETAHFYQLGLQPRVWSSSTLYTEEKKQKRLEWFNEFTSARELNADTILSFHKTAGLGNLDYGTVMNRGHVKTTSITQIEKTDHTIQIRFENLNTSEITTKTFNIQQLVND